MAGLLPLVQRGGDWAKVVDTKRYREVLLKNQMLPVTLLATRLCLAVQLLQQETPNFISLDLWPQKSPDLTRLPTEFGD